MEIKKAFILVELDGKEGLRQIAFDKENQEMLILLIKSGLFGKEIKVMDEVVAEVGKNDT